jgi:tetratricopeptide (TPR) repeat protein
MDGPDSPDRQARNEIEESMAALLFLMGQVHEARTLYDALLSRIDDVLVSARIQSKLATLYRTQGDYKKAQETARTSLRQLGQHDIFNKHLFFPRFIPAVLVHLQQRFLPVLTRRQHRATERTRFKYIIANYRALYIVFYFTDIPRYIFTILRISILSESLGKTKDRCFADIQLNLLYAACGLFGSATRYIDRAFRDAEDFADAFYIAMTHNWRGVTCMYMARLHAMERHLETARSILNSCGDFYELGMCYLHLGYCLLYQGRYRQDMERTGEGVAYLQHAETDLLLNKTVLIHNAMARTKLGLTDNVHEDMEQTVRMCIEQGDVVEWACFTVFKGDMHLVLDELDQAVESFERSLALVKKHKIYIEYTSGVYAYLVRCYAERIRREPDMPRRERRRLHRSMRKLSRFGLTYNQLMHPMYVAPSHAARGISLWFDGRKRRAKKHFSRAMTIAEQQDAGMWLSEACWEAGRCMITGNAQERQLGIAYLQRARDLFEQQEYRPMLQRVQSLLETLETP